MRQEPVWAQSLHKKEQGGLHVLRPWGTHVHGAVSKTPICPVLASRLLARGSLCRLPAAPPRPEKAVSAFSFLLTTPNSHPS